MWTGRIQPPLQGPVLRGKVDEQEEPVTRPFDRRIWRGVDGHASLQQKEPHAQPPPKQMKSSGSDKPVYSKFQIVSLVDFDINISVALSHVVNICSVLYTLNRVYQYYQQFRLRIAESQTRTWSQIDGNWWLQFIAKGPLGNRSWQQLSFQFLLKCHVMESIYENINIITKGICQNFYWINLFYFGGLICEMLQITLPVIEIPHYQGDYITSYCIYVVTIPVVRNMYIRVHKRQHLEFRKSMP
jgi:hypothetical protein